jgi:hypothetical protein
MAHLFTVKHFRSGSQNSDVEQTAPRITIIQNEKGIANADEPLPLSTNASESDSWLDFSPSTGNHRKLAPVVHLNDIHEDLVDIQVSVYNRELLIQLAAKNPRYFLVPNHTRNWTWKLDTEKDRRIYNAIRSQVERIGNDATIEKIREWEEKLGDLWSRTLNLTDKSDAEIQEWPSYIPGTFQEDWNWADAMEQHSSAVMQESVSPKTKNMSPHKDAGLYSNLSTRYKAGDWR